MSCKKLIDETLNNYIEKIDSHTPTPGGGSVAALVGSLACALAGMVAHFTINKKDFKEMTKENQEIFYDAIKKINIIKENLKNIIDEDADVFNEFLAISKNDKNTEKEQKIIYKLLTVSLNTLKYCYELTYEFEKVLKYGNKNLVPDILIAFILLNATSKSSIVNINVNLKFFNENNILLKFKKDSLLYIDRINSIYKDLEERVKLFHIQL